MMKNKILLTLLAALFLGCGKINTPNAESKNYLFSELNEEQQNSSTKSSFRYLRLT
jgi:hypothetical protein